MLETLALGFGATVASAAAGIGLCCAIHKFNGELPQP
jgi:hypothetical protein